MTHSRVNIDFLAERQAVIPTAEAEKDDAVATRNFADIAKEIAMKVSKCEAPIASISEPPRQACQCEDRSPESYAAPLRIQCPYIRLSD